MAEFPKLPLFTDALLGDTQDLSAEEFGAYMLMLIVAWRSRGCSLPNDEVKLRRITRLAPGRWARLKDTLLGFWDLGEDGKWRQKRLSLVHQHVAVLVAQKKSAAKARWLKNKKTKDANGYTKPMEAKVQIQTAAIEAADAAPMSGPNINGAYQQLVDHLQRNLAFAHITAFRLGNDWLNEGIPFDTIISAIGNRTRTKREREEQWQPRDLRYFDECVHEEHTRANIVRAAVPRGNGWTGFYDGTQINAAARAGLKVLRIGAARNKWMNEHNFVRERARHPDVQAAAKREGVYIESERD